MALTPKQRKAALEKGFSVNLATEDDSKYRSPNRIAATELFAKAADGYKTKPSLPADGVTEQLPADGLERQTVDRQYYRQTVSQHYRQTGSEKRLADDATLPADGQPVVEGNEAAKSIPLAPVQWALWSALRAADMADEVVSYRKLALIANASTRGIRDALAVIEKEGGIRAKTTIRTPDEQGMRIETEASTSFRLASIKETKGLLRRDGNYRQTVNRQSLALPADGLRLSVSITEYIKQTDLADLLLLLPPTWSIRERTLIEIARSFPRMTLIELRRSLLLLVEQASKGRTQIQNHNAWLKAAFTKSEGPLVTERMIEARLDHVAANSKDNHADVARRKQGEELHVENSALRRYLTAPPEQRQIIEERAKEKSLAALRMMPTDKHDQIREQALIDASMEFFATLAKET